MAVALPQTTPPAPTPPPRRRSRLRWLKVTGIVLGSVVLGLVPTKGIPLPLVSAGGSSLLINLLGIGMLLNISQHESADA